jgi:hypothetical protein
VHNVAVPFTGHHELWHYAELRQFSGAKPAHFDFFSSNFNVLEMLLTHKKCERLKVQTGMVKESSEYKWGGSHLIVVLTTFHGVKSF